MKEQKDTGQLEKKGLVIFSHGGHDDSEEYLLKKKEQFSNIVIMNWAGFKGMEINCADYILNVPSYSSESLFLLYELTEKKYEYYMFVDDDMVFEDGVESKLCSLLEEYKPLLAHCFDLRCSHGRNKKSGELSKIRNKGGVQQCIAGDLPLIWHYSVIEKLYPFPFYFDYRVNYLPQFIVYSVQSEKFIRFSDIRVKNKRHKRPKGKSVKDHKKYKPGYWNPFLKIKVESSFRDFCLFITEMNKELHKRGDKGISKENVVLGDISPVVNQRHREWRQREYLLPRFREYIDHGKR